MDTNNKRPSPFETPLPESDKSPRRRSNFALAVTGMIAIGLLIIAYLMLARTVSISANAPNLFVQSDSLLEVNLGDRLLLLPGKHRIEISAPGYRNQSLEIELTTAEKNWHQQLQLQPLPGKLTVHSKVAAEIFLNDQAVGQSGEKLDGIEAGSYQMRVVAPRYKPLLQSLTIEGKGQHQKLEITLTPDWVNAALQSNPSGADVRVDGELQGQTPIELQLLSGIRQIQVSKPGFSDWLQTLNISTDKALVLPPIDLNPASAQLPIRSSPTGAQVTINGVYQGETPLTAAVDPGATVDVMLIKAGFKTLRRTLTLSQNNNEQQPLQLTLAPILGRINLNIVPIGARVNVNGQTQQATTTDQDQARYSLRLPAAPQNIQISHPGFASQTLRLTPRPDMAQHLNVSLLTNAQSRWQNIPQTTTTATGQAIALYRPDATFMMGASRREQGRRANETQYQVKIDRPFYASPKHVSNQDFRQFERYHSSGNVKGVSLNGEQQPVVKISWSKAAQFCNWLSAQEGLQPVYQFQDGKLTDSNPDHNGYRLPTEAEWAWLARYENGRMRTYPWAGTGLSPPNHSGNFADTKALPLAGGALPRYVDKYPVTAPVASYPANHLGVYDLAGNVSEWLHDFYGIKTGLSLKASPNPSGPASGDHHVIRGSSWKSASISELRLAWRDSGSGAQDSVGFRVVRSVIIEDK
ncbi:MAG: PEGA domain-containing protein [Candidatus Pelagadaptatus aseana]|uniref:PEGA domain-containing protein n=1 Tax=Candidatus Pelagadaptatus aseana TaxID=3120508 RepID=UPI0039B1D130